MSGVEGGTKMVFVARPRAGFRSSHVLTDGEGGRGEGGNEGGREGGRGG